MIRINERLNLVMPLYRGDDIYAWVHSTPVSREVFEANYLLVSKTFAAIHAEGLGEIAGPRVAYLTMKQIAGKMGQDGQASAAALMDEVRRLSNVLMPGLGGWQALPLQDALAGGMLDPDDIAEVENSLAFFIVVSAMHRAQTLRAILPGAAQLWGALTSSLNCTEYRASLQTSIAVVNSGGTAAPIAPAGQLTITEPDGSARISSLPS